MLNWQEVIARSTSGNPSPPRRVEKSEAQWRESLSPEQFRVTRERGTERAFSSQMCELFEEGVYRCVCCDTTLFDSRQKYESGSGWPSFTQPVQDNVIAYHGDRSHGMIRVEVSCAVCDAHLGHIFPDGPPQAGGLRYCVNSVSLRKSDES